MYQIIQKEYESYLERAEKLIENLKNEKGKHLNQIRDLSSQESQKKYVDLLVKECNEESNSGSKIDHKSFTLICLITLVTLIISITLVRFNIVSYRQYTLEQVLAGIPQEYLRTVIIPVIITFLSLMLFAFFTYLLSSRISEYKMKSVFNKLLNTSVSLHSQNEIQSVIQQGHLNEKLLLNSLDKEQKDLRAKILLFLNDKKNACDDSYREQLIQILMKLDETSAKLNSM